MKINLFIIALFAYGCSHSVSVTEEKIMDIKCNICEVKDPTTLDLKSLPHTSLKLISKKSQVKHLDLFSKLIDDFNRNGDKYMNEIFMPLLSDSSFQIDVVATQGVPEPYDAWSTDYQGKKSFFFNMDLWSVTDLKHSGLAVIKHEVTHVLLSKLLDEPNPNDYVEVLEEIVLNEGIAHFIGHPNRENLLNAEYKMKWQNSEKQLEEAFKKLSSSHTAKSEKDDLIHKSNTGKFWNKYGAISGMFRVAHIYESSGPQGIIDCIRNNKLSRVVPDEK